MSRMVTEAMVEAALQAYANGGITKSDRMRAALEAALSVPAAERAPTEDFDRAAFLASDESLPNRFAAEQKAEPVRKVQKMARFCAEIAWDTAFAWAIDHGRTDQEAYNAASAVRENVLVHALQDDALSTQAIEARNAVINKRCGIYIASKVKHAARWRALRAAGVPIVSTWIDEAGEGESSDLNDLWHRCLAEASNAAAIVVYREPDETLKGAWVELGAAASHGVPVFAVGLREFTISNHDGIEHFDTLDAALRAAEARQL